MARKTEKTDNSVPNPLVESGVEKMIQIVRGKQVLLDRDIATLYGVETRAINQAVKRNVERFPDRYCFQLEKGELGFLKSHKKKFVHKLFGQKQIFTLRFHRKRPLYACDDLKKPNFLIKVWHGSCIY